MKKTPKALRLHIGIFGRTNVGKSSFLNLVAGQDVAITSPIPGTTTDVVEKTMELLPVGPVVFLDTAGLDDTSLLGERRIRKTEKIFDRSDVIVLMVESERWDESEDMILREAQKRDIPIIVAINKIDILPPSEEFIKMLGTKTPRLLPCSSIASGTRDATVHLLKQYLLEVGPDDFFKPPPLIGDLLPPGGLAVLIIPIDLEAPKGRLILPQVQTIRDALDHNAATLVVKESEYAAILQRLSQPPDLVVCDSQVVAKMVADTPNGVPCTTFSILLARYKGDLISASRGAAALRGIKPNDKILVAEACSHHPIEDDIGRVKIPRWLKQFTGVDLHIDTCAGRDFPANLKEYQLIIHCGACMLTRREMLARIEKAKEAGVPLTNYGVAISVLQGVIDRALSPFPEALKAYQEGLPPSL